MSYSRPSKLVAELIGTFTLIFIGAGAGVVLGGGAGIAGLTGVALAHGLVVLAYAYAYGDVSGTHVNPAVTLGLLAAGQITVADAIAYVVVQLAGGLAGALALALVLGGTATGLGAPALASGLQLGQVAVTVTPFAGLLVEAVLAFFLVTVILNTAVAGRGGNAAGIAIGLTLTLNILMGGALTGAAFNPARALGPMIVSGNLANAWLYVVGPIVGGVAAALAYPLTRPPR
jgi:aquaporin Z